MRPRERRFVAEFLRQPDAAKAARAAGYAASRAWFHGLRLLNKTEVRAAIERARETRAERVGLTGDRVLLEYARIAFADLARVLRPDPDLKPLPLLELGADEAAAIASLSWGAKGGGPARLHLHEKDFAIEALCEYFNIYDAEAWRDDSEGARERLLARLAEMAAAEDVEREAEAATAEPRADEQNLC